MGAQAKIRAERRAENEAAKLWHPLTNIEVAKAADPKCKRCCGDGLSFDEKHTPIVCPCAPPRYAAKNRSRMRPGPGGTVEVRGD